jgi:hypothetical protein
MAGSVNAEYELRDNGRVNLLYGITLFVQVDVATRTVTEVMAYDGCFEPPKLEGAPAAVRLAYEIAEEDIWPLWRVGDSLYDDGQELRGKVQCVPYEGSCGCCNADLAPSTTYPWHYRDDECRATRQPLPMVFAEDSVEASKVPPHTKGG